MKNRIREIAIFGMLGAIMFISKLLMEFLPNIHLVGVLTVAFTLVYRRKALYPIYIYVLLSGIYAGFNMWWIPYLYLWTFLWGAVMLLPKNLPKRWAPLIYMAVCSLHGFLYGTLYAPTQAFFFGLDWCGMIAWIVAGLPFDAIHGISNFCCGILIIPITKAIYRADSGISPP